MILALAIVLTGLAMPHHYKVVKQTHSDVNTTTLSPLVLSHWPVLFNWQPTQDIYFRVLPKSQHIGSSAILMHPWGEAEMTITKLTAQTLSVSLHIDDEHIAKITLNLLSYQADNKQLSIIIEGRANTPFIGSFIALFMQQYLQQVTNSAVNHMNTLYKLRA
ncbi:hypothetical protein [Pseudoalteromonas piscicida]|uniref:hypothetical protein n=1 Tax=Pseudoalteromonas piscicida TaxID=43662 RepID=UPI00309516A1